MNNYDKNNCKISFLGDISLNGDYENMYKNKLNPFSEVSNFFDKKTIVVGNLECFSRGDFGFNELKKPRLSTSKQTLNYLKDIKLQIACLANNHVFDHLDDGFQKTLNFLESNKIKKIGASFSKEEQYKPIIISQNGIKICLLNYVTPDTNPKPPVNTKISVNWFDLSSTVNQINEHKKNVDHVVVSLHWGGRVEGGLYPDFDQPTIAKELIDSGADLIIGHHSHTIQPYEIYKEKYIFYSLGNFCFSDFYFEGDFYKMPKRRRYCLIVSVIFDKEKYVLSTDYFFNDNGKIIKSNYYYRVFIRNLIFKHLIKFDFVWRMYYFNLRKILPIYFYLIDDTMSLCEKYRRLNYKKLKKYLTK